MKTLNVALLFVLPLTVFAGEVKLGDSLESVRSTLGTPRGQSHLSGRDVLYFDRGEIELSAGLVTRVALRSEKDQAVFENKQVANADRVRQEQETKHAQAITEGTAVKARMLADPAFQATPLSYQVAFWKNFSRKYSTVSCAEELSIAQARLNEQIEVAQKQAAQAQRIAELEAQARADAARDSLRYAYNRSYENSGYFPSFIPSSYDPNSRYARRAYNDFTPCQPSAPAPRVHSLPEPQPSSQTAEAFSGKNWLVWPGSSIETGTVTRKPRASSY